MAMIKFFVTVFVVFTLIISILMLPLYFYRKKKDPDNKKNTVRRLIITVFVGVLLFTGICTFWFIRFGKALIEKDDNGSGSISIIGGVDGPTSIFIAGKLDGSDTAEFKEKINYMEISQAEAKELMDNKESGAIILDVRRPDEYAEGHIEGAINVPNESIIDTAPEELPDKNKLILVYCRSGRRSKEAAGKLVSMGYTDIKEFGGIIDWPYGTVK